MLISRISNDLGVPSYYIERVSRSAPYYYKWYKIPKSSGGFRDIYQPSPVLKAFQYWIIDNIINVMPISPFSTAYSQGDSIAKNATKHLNKNFLVHFDIKNFFPSITKYHLRSLLLNNQQKISEKLETNLNEYDFELICRLLLYKGGLTIGSPSSPKLSNAVMYNVDIALGDYANANEYIYTRYADDMIFSSTKYIPSEIENKVEEILSIERLQLNKSKTYFMGPKDRKIVTGVNVNNQRLTIGRRRRDAIKNMVYKKLKYGKGDSQQIIGYLNFLKSVDPVYYEKIIQKYPGILNALKNS